MIDGKRGSCLAEALGAVDQRGVVIIGSDRRGLAGYAPGAEPYLEEFHRTLDSAVMLLTTDGDEIQEDPEAFVQRKRRPCSRRARISA